MLIGYARVSTTEQDTALQTDALSRAGVSTIYQDKISAVKRRPALQRALASLTPASTLVVYKVDRLARSLSDLLEIIATIDRAGASFKSLTEPIDTSTPAGRMSLQLLGAFAEFERAIIRERSIAGQQAAVFRGARVGRPRKLGEEGEAQALAMLCSGLSTANVADYFGVHPSTIKRLSARLRRSVEGVSLRDRALWPEGHQAP